ncbi:MAG: nitroreductase family protein [Candidatus Omnitrophota bacterium]
MLKDLITQCRSYRRFQQDYKIGKETLEELVDLARLSGSASNLQPLKYMLSHSLEKNDVIFMTLNWAGYLKHWPGPKESERPSAYIIILGDTTISDKFDWDCGIASQSILLGAVEKGLGGCMVASVKRDSLRRNLSIPEKYQIILVIALGKPAEKIILEEAKGDIKYYRDKDDSHHVPKRPLKEVIIDDSN